ncbi:MAG: PKD domain-containing protein, partial [Bacteroidetes bacterium]|nr:PKD domain-containing protein [Bacteroidota bacterium]
PGSAMRKLLWFICLAGLLFHFNDGFAQQLKNETAKKGIYEQLDSRVDNMKYWMKMAEKGLTPFNPDLALTPAIFTGSKISVRGVTTSNSPDIPVSNLANITESENSVFIDPNNADAILNSNNSTSWTGSAYGTIYGANYFQSSTAGIGWAGSPYGAGGSNGGDPTTAIGLNGREYVNFINSSSGQGIAFSDNGTSWTTAMVATNPGDLADKNHMWIDNKPTSLYEGNLYTAWTDFGGTDDTEIKISRSVNDGVSWSAPLNISSAVNAGSHNQGVNIQTGPEGEVYVAWAVYDSWPIGGSDEKAIGFSKSTNGGVNYRAATRVISNIRGIRRTAVSKNHRVNSYPVMAVDISGGPGNGNIYIVWTNVGTPGVNTGTNKSIYLIRSTDGGTSWSSPVRVNQGPQLEGKESYFPWISCDAETGALSVVFYDDRNVSGTQCEVFVAFSTDAGNTWTDFQVSDVAFTPTPIPGLADGYMGDYLGITSKGGKVYPCWTDNRGGVYMTYVSPFELGPNARFYANKITNCTGSGVTFTDESTGGITSWTWDFPGGTPSIYSGKYPPDVVYGNPGTYDVSLTVSDGSANDTETKTSYITVRDVIADFTGTPATVATENTVIFTNNSSCGPETWNWSFPGGTPSSFIGQSPPPIRYDSLGTFDVSLIVTRPGVSDTLSRPGYITVVQPVFNIANGSVTTCTGTFYDSGGPSANYQGNESFTETFHPSTPGSQIRFDFTSFLTELNRDTLTIYNGVNTSAPKIGKYYGTTSPGTVTASNSSGALTFRFQSDGSINKAGWAASISCYLYPEIPVADFSASSTNPIVAQTVTFTDLSANFPISWAWSFSPATVTFAGGTSESSQNPQVQFALTGLYTVSLIATNLNGSDTIIKTDFIHVTNCNISAFPWKEGFESGGAIPNCWTQVMVNNSGLSWIFIAGNGGSNPPKAHGGSYNACLKDNNSADNKTRLITPTLNLLSIENPQLRFWHTQGEWYGTQDQLSVYYKTSAGGSWILLTTYMGSITAWTQETIPLPSPSDTYSIAFEGNAKWGRGVCLDDVEVGFPIRALNNITVDSTGCFSAPQTIMIAGSGTFFSVPSGGDATIIAGENILYYPGTVVASGGYMYGHIAPEGPWCSNQPVAAAVLSGTQEIRPEAAEQLYSIYPNPTTGAFTIELNHSMVSEKWLIEIFSMKGDKVFSDVMEGERKHEFSLSGKPEGIYLIRVSGELSSGTTRIIKQN